jgi:hypothetical protein
MKVIIAGSRTIKDYKLVESAIKNSGFKITEVVCGCASGVDTLGEKWALANNIKVKKFPADWDKYGRSAGYKRNVQMAEYADACIVVYTGPKSAGSQHMIDIATKRNLKLYVKKHEG